VKLKEESKEVEVMMGVRRVEGGRGFYMLPF
jgi:hypothetical protein